MYEKSRITFPGPIEAILPTYDNQGNNTCCVISAQGTSTTFPMKVSKFVRLLFQSLRIDLYAQRMWSQEILNQRNLNPIVIHKDHVLIPVKFRSPIGAKDGCYGYICSNNIQSITPDYILLASGNKIPYLSCIKTIKEKMQHAKLLNYTYAEELCHYHLIYGKKD